VTQAAVIKHATQTRNYRFECAPCWTAARLVEVVTARGQNLSTLEETVWWTPRLTALNNRHTNTYKHCSSHLISDDLVLSELRGTEYAVKWRSSPWLRPIEKADGESSDDPCDKAKPGRPIQSAALFWLVAEQRRRWDNTKSLETKLDEVRFVKWPQQRNGRLILMKFVSLLYWSLF